jgi:hypothetical protein
LPWGLRRLPDVGEEGLEGDDGVAVLEQRAKLL